MHAVTTPEHERAARRLRELLAVWEENEELIRLGAYKAGASPAVDPERRQPPLPGPGSHRVGPLRDDGDRARRGRLRSMIAERVR
jgi:hypothetical protein